MQNVYLRLALYVLSIFVGLLPAWAAGYVTYDAETAVLTVQVEAVLAAIFTGSGISAGIFRRWGVR